MMDARGMSSAFIPLTHERPGTTEMGEVMVSCNALHSPARHCPTVVLHPAQMEHANGVLVY